MSQIRGVLTLRDSFPKPEEVKRTVRRYLVPHTKVTERACLAILRHNFTNYDQLRKRNQYDYESLKETVNSIILKEIEGWNSSKESGPRY